MLPAEDPVLTPSSRHVGIGPRTRPGLIEPPGSGESIQSKLSQMQASLDSLLQSIRAAGLALPLPHPEQPFGIEQATHSPSIETVLSRRDSDGGSNTTVEELGALVGIEDTMRSISGLRDAMQSLRAQNTPSQTENTTIEQTNLQQSLSPLSRNEALGAINSFRDEVNTLYPFVDLAALSSLVDTVYSSAPMQTVRDRRTAEWNDIEDGRNLDLLRLIIACALAAKSKEENDLSHDLMKPVEEKSVEMTCTPLAPLFCIIYRGALTPSIHSEFKLFSLLPTLFQQKV
jgi:hypothetical protein